MTNKIKVEEVLGIDGYEVTRKVSKRNSKKRVKGKDGRCWKCVVYYRATLDSDSPVTFDEEACEDGTTDLRWFGLDELKKIRLRIPNTLPFMIKALQYDEPVKAGKLIKTFRAQGKDNTTLEQIFKLAAMSNKDETFLKSLVSQVDTLYHQPLSFLLRGPLILTSEPSVPFPKLFLNLIFPKTSLL